MDEMSVEKWWNETDRSGKLEKPKEQSTQTPFVHLKTNLE